MERKRRPALDEVKQREVCAVLAMGGSRAVAAQYVGCHVITIRRRAKRDPDFALALERAVSQHEITNLANINKAGKDGRYWRAAAWALERAYPERYGARKPRTVTVDQLGKVLSQFADSILENVTDDEQRRRILERLSELAGQFQTAAAKGASR